MNLVLHVGLPKTGTTTLQKMLFPKLPLNYLGRNDGDADLLDKPRFSELRRLVTGQHKITDADLKERTRKWVDSALSASS